MLCMFLSFLVLSLFLFLYVVLRISAFLQYSPISVQARTGPGPAQLQREVPPQLGSLRAQYRTRPRFLHSAQWGLPSGKESRWPSHQPCPPNQSPRRAFCRAVDSQHRHDSPVGDLTRPLKFLVRISAKQLGLSDIGVSSQDGTFNLGKEGRCQFPRQTPHQSGGWGGSSRLILTNFLSSPFYLIYYHNA